MKGVILAGGKGTRMLPATKVINKALLPVYTDQGAVPMIFFPINTLVSAGIDDILVVSSREQCGQIIGNLGDGTEFNCNFTYKIQDVNYVEMGVASALKLAKGFTKDEDFLVILGDNFFEDNLKAAAGPRHSKPGRFKAGIYTREVPDPERFGVVSRAGDRWKIVEKPKKPETNMAVVGLYHYTSDVYNVAEQLQLSERGELEITDISSYYAKRDELAVSPILGYWSDMGTPESLIRTQEHILKSGFRITAFHP